MAWCCQATSHYLSQCWPSSLSPYGITRPQWVEMDVVTYSCWDESYSMLVKGAPNRGIILLHSRVPDHRIAVNFLHLPQLLWHVQNCVAIIVLEFGWEQNDICITSTWITSERSLVLWVSGYPSNHDKILRLAPYLMWTHWSLVMPHGIGELGHHWFW